MSKNGKTEQPVEDKQAETVRKADELGVVWHDVTKIFKTLGDVEAFDNAFVYAPSMEEQLVYLGKMIKSVNIEGLDVQDPQSWRNTAPRVFGILRDAAWLESRKVFQ